MKSALNVETPDDPSSTITGAWVALENPGWVVPSIVRGSPIVGRELSGEITWGAGPGSRNSIRSGPGVAFAAESRLRSVCGPESAVEVTTRTGLAAAGGALAADAA